MRGAALLFAGGLLLSAAAREAAAQEPQYFEEPPEKPKVWLQWDFLARYDRVDHLPYGETLDRGRFELRPQVNFRPWKDFQIGVRGIFDYGTQPYAYPYEDNYIARWASADRWFIQWTPGAFNFRAGRFAMPFLATELMWDRDIQTPGVAASWTSPGGTWTIVGAGLYGPQHYSDQTRIGAGQVQFQAGDPTRFQIQAAFAFWYFQPHELYEDYIRQNSIRLLVNGRPTFDSDFRVGDLLLRFRFPIGSVPILVSLDGLANFDAAKNRNLGYEASVVAGGVGTPGNFRGFYTYQYIERDATMGAYNTDDWWYHTWYEGHRVGVAWTFLPSVYLQGSMSIQRRLDVHTWVNRYLVDLVKMF